MPTIYRLISLLALGLLLACSQEGSGVTADAEPAPVGSPSAAGTISVSANTVVDSDVLNPAAPSVSNDTGATAQEIGNPATVGGYASAATDTSDFYRATLAPNQVVRLTQGSLDMGADLDLYLTDELGVDAGSSAQAGTLVEQVNAPAVSKTYLVEVRAVGGATTYVLTIGQGIASAGLPAEFVPEQVIVRLREGGQGFAAGVSPRARMQAIGLTTLREGRRGTLLVGCRGAAARARVLGALGMGRRAAAGPVVDTPERRLRETRELAAALRVRDDVVSADLNYVRHAHAVPQDVLYPRQWHYPLINLPAAWDNVLTVPDVPANYPVVAVVDTGVATDHVDLAGRFDPANPDGADFVTDPDDADGIPGCDGDADDPGSLLFHGTHVAGTIAARTSLQTTGGGTGGVAGAAFRSTILPLRALDTSGSGTDFDIMNAIRYAAGFSTPVSCNPDNPGVAGPDIGMRRADVVNLSLGGPGFSQTFQDLITSATDDRGVIFVASAGNSASDALIYPAAYDDVISVSAVDIQKNLAPYSSFGLTIDVAAPGGDLSADVDGSGEPDGVLSTVITGAPNNRTSSYFYFQGTSMAAPHVSGVIALMLFVNDTLTPAGIETLLTTGMLTEDIGNPAQFGNGLIDAFAAVDAAFVGAPPADQPLLAVDPGGLDFGALATEIVVDVRNAGGDGAPISVTDHVEATTDGGGWLLDTQAVAVDADGLGSYRIRIDRAAAGGSGVFTGSVTFTSGVNAAQLLVVMREGVAAPDLDAGQLFILLLDPDTFQSRAEIRANANAGQYAFDFQGIDPGSYVLVAGSDNDNDGEICDPGESCGGYPTLDSLAQFEVTAPFTGLNFSAGFGIGVSASSTGPGGSLPASRTFERLSTRDFAR